MGMRVKGEGVVTKKKEPFHATDKQSGKPTGQVYYSIELGYVGGKVNVNCNAAQHAELPLGAEVSFIGGLNTEGGKTRVELEQFKVTKAPQQQAA
jgi:hypothetical protein